MFPQSALEFNSHNENENKKIISCSVRIHRVRVRSFFTEFASSAYRIDIHLSEKLQIHVDVSLLSNENRNAF